MTHGSAVSKSPDRPWLHRILRLSAPLAWPSEAIRVASPYRVVPVWCFEASSSISPIPALCGHYDSFGDSWLLAPVRHRYHFSIKARPPQVRTDSFTAQPRDLHHLALITRASRLLAPSPCLAIPHIRFLFIGSQLRYTLSPSLRSPHNQSPSSSCASLRSL